MGYTYGTVFGGFCVLTICTVIFGFVFSGRFKIIRYLTWTLSFLLFVLTVWIQVNHSMMISAYEKQYVGIYHFDYKNSIYDSTILIKYKDLTLTVNGDNTFEVSRIAPFFKSTQGHWNYFDDGDIAFIEGGFNFSADNFQTMASSTRWVFETSDLRNLKNGQKIIFTK